MAKTKVKKKGSIFGVLKKQNKFKLAYLGAAAFLLVSSVGYGGFVQYKKNALKAEAGGWTSLRNNSVLGLAWARACKTYVGNSGYGNLYKVELQAYRNTGDTHTIQIRVFRNNRYLTEVNQNNWLYGVVAGVGQYVSADLNDTVQFNVFGNRYGSWGLTIENGSYSNIISMSQLANC